MQAQDTGELLNQIKSNQMKITWHSRTTPFGKINDCRALAASFSTRLHHGVRGGGGGQLGREGGGGGGRSGQAGSYAGREG